MRFSPIDQPVTSVVALSDGRRVVSRSEDRTVRVWDVNTGFCERVLEGHSGVSRISLIPSSFTPSFLASPLYHQRVTSLVALSDGRRVVSGSWDSTVRVWDVNTGSCERVLEGHSWVSRISLIPPSYDHCLPSFTPCFLASPLYHQWVRSVVALSDGHRVVSGSWDSTVRVWDVNIRLHISPMIGHQKVSFLFYILNC